MPRERWKETERDGKREGEGEKEGIGYHHQIAQNVTKQAFESVKACTKLV